MPGLLRFMGYRGLGSSAGFGGVIGPGAGAAVGSADLGA
jgi:hypothetical protein